MKTLREPAPWIFLAIIVAASIVTYCAKKIFPAPKVYHFELVTDSIYEVPGIGGTRENPELALIWYDTTIDDKILMRIQYAFPLSKEGNKLDSIAIKQSFWTRDSTIIIGLDSSLISSENE